MIFQKKLKGIFLVGLIIILCISGRDNPAFAQNTGNIPVNKHYSNKNLEGILLDLAKSYKFRLDYDKEVLPKGDVSTRIYIKKPLSEVLQDLFSGTGLFYEFERHNILVVKGTAPEETVEVVFKPTRQNFSLTGKVIEERSGESLPFATVMIKSNRKGTTTNQDGFFSLPQVPTDTSTLVFHYMGFTTLNLKLTPNLISDLLVIEMESADTQLEEVVISAKAEKMIKASESVSKIILSPTQVSKLPKVGETDIFRSLQLLPGVSGTNETSSGLYVRGGTPDQNLVLLDGFTVYHVDHFYGFFSAFNADAIKDVQFYKGGFESIYGGRISSVVDLTGKTGNTRKFSLSGGISALSVNATAEIPFGNEKGSILLSARRSYTDIIKSGLYNDINDLFKNEETQTGPMPGGGGMGGFRNFSQQTVEPAFYFYDLNAKASYWLTKKDIISFSLYNGQDNLDNSNEFNDTFNFGQTGTANTRTVANETTDLLKWGNWGSSLQWGHQWSGNIFTDLTMAYSNYYSKRDRYSTSSITREDTVTSRIMGSRENNDLNDIMIRFNNSFNLNNSNLIEFGIQTNLIKSDYELTRNDTINILDRKDEGNTFALYLQDTWSPGSRLTITPGIRSTYYNTTDQFYWEPRISAVYHFIDRFKIKGAWGQYYQFTNRIVREDITEGSRDFWLMADDNEIPVSSATHYIAGLSYETKNFLFDVEGFYKPMEGLTEYSLRFANPRRGYEELFFQGSGYAKGVEFLVQKKAGQYTGWLGYTLSKVEHTFEEISENSYPAIHDQTHEFKSVNLYTIGQWDFGATWIYATGKPYTAPVGGYELTLLDGNTNSYISIGEKNSLRLPDYHRLDVSATYNFNLGRGKAQAGLSIFNLYNRQNVWYKTFEVLEDELIVTDINTLGITPNFFVNIKF
ncbi:TonB-dependent receptor domain-containing protein [Bacteroidota bacterium]